MLPLLALASMPMVAQNSSTMVKGHVKGYPDGTKVYIGTLADVPDRYTDSTTVKGGEFAFFVPDNAQTKSSPLVVNCVTDPTHFSATELYAAPGNTLDCYIDAAEEGMGNYVMGSPLNFINHKLIEELKPIYDQIIPLRKTVRDANASAEAKKKAEQQADSLYSISTKIQKNYAFSNMDNIFGIGLLRNLSYEMTLNEMDSVLRLVPETMKNNPQVVALQKSLDTDRKTADGNPMIDVTLPNVKGKMTSLSSLVKKNKLTIVDFWASWCGPCRAELPEMKKIYAEFKSKGVGMVGVSFDSKKEAWLKAIKTMGLDYQHISDLKGWGSAAAKAYNVKGIPFTMLINKKGVIVGRDLHGDDLKARIVELLK